MDAQTEKIAELDRLLDDGQVFLAQDLARDLIDAGVDDPQVSGLYALALIRSGAVDAAEAVLAAVPGLADVDAAADRATYAALTAHAVAAVRTIAPRSGTGLLSGCASLCA